MTAIALVIFLQRNVWLQDSRAQRAAQEQMTTEEFHMYQAQRTAAAAVIAKHYRAFRAHCATQQRRMTRGQVRCLVGHASRRHTQLRHLYVTQWLVHVTAKLNQITQLRGQSTCSWYVCTGEAAQRRSDWYRVGRLFSGCCCASAVCSTTTIQTHADKRRAGCDDTATGDTWAPGEATLGTRQS